jgi:hypothetical protein
MALSRKWMPTPNVSSRSGSAVRLIVLHTTEGAQDITSLGSFFGSSSVQASSHVGIDNGTRGLIGEEGRPADKAWTQANANPYCISCEICTPSGAAANWSDATWRSKPVMLANIGEWIAEEAKRYGIPITRLTASQAQGGSKGVCQHRDLGAAGGGHSDCGNGFPMDYVLSLARGGSSSASTPAPQPAEDLGVSASVAFDSKGGAWYASIGSADGGVFYQKSGAGIAIDKNDRVVIVYTNASKDACTYTLAPGASNWSWAKIGGSVRLGAVVSAAAGSVVRLLPRNQVARAGEDRRNGLSSTVSPAPRRYEGASQ